MICPYCNAEFDAAGARRLGGTAFCPRCGDPLPSHLVPEVPAPAQPAAAPPSSGTPWTNRKIALSIVIGMLLMASVGLVFALTTEGFRRHNDYRVKKEQPLPLTVQAPGELAGLGYLPADCNVVAAMQVAEF